MAGSLLSLQGSMRTVPIMPVKVLDDVAVEWNRYSNTRIAEVHSQGHPWVSSKSITGRHVHGIAQGRFLPSVALSADHDKVQLVNVEGMGLPGTILYVPVFDFSLTNRDRWLAIVGIEQNRRSTLFSHKEQCRTVWVAWI